MLPTTIAGRPVRFLLVGGWNTAFGWLAFAGFLRLATAAGLSYVWATVPAQIVAIANAYICQRVFVFNDQKTGVQRSLLRFCGVYTVLYFVNLPVLMALVWTGLHPLVAQAVLIALNVMVSYVVHLRFTFQPEKKPAVPEV